MKLRNCPVCGTRCSETVSICPECGFELNKYFTKPAGRTRKVPVYVWILILVWVIPVALAVAVFSGHLVRKNESRPAAESAEADTSAASDEVSSGEDSPGVSDEVSSEADSPAASDEVTAEPEIITEANVSGVYSGDDHEILVLDDDNKAYYYCAEIQFTDLQCPWYVENDRVFIDFDRLHCTVSADLGEKELVFRSGSINWNPEVFTRLNVEPDEYLTRALSTYDQNAILNMDGTITCSMDGITYTIPKVFMDYPDEFDSDPYSSGFVEVDAQKDYAATLLFYREPGESLTSDEARSKATSFSVRFYNKASVDKVESTTVAGHPGYICSTSGFLNNGFGEMLNYAVDGFIIVFYNEDTHYTNYISYMRSSDRSADSIDSIYEMIRTAHD